MRANCGCVLYTYIKTRDGMNSQCPHFLDLLPPNVHNVKEGRTYACIAPVFATPFRCKAKAQLFYFTARRSNWTSIPLIPSFRVFPASSQYLSHNCQNALWRDLTSRETKEIWHIYIFRFVDISSKAESIHSLTSQLAPASMSTFPVAAVSMAVLSLPFRVLGLS